MKEMLMTRVRGSERGRRRERMRMKRGDDMLGMGAWVKGRCLTEKGFKRHIMGRKRVLPVTKELAFFSHQIQLDLNYVQ